MLFLILLLVASGLRSGYAQDVPAKVQLSLLGGLERQSLNWSIAGNTSGANPNVFSELKWQRVKGTLAVADLAWNAWRRFSVLGGYSRAFTTSGTVSDIDYAGDGRTQPIYTGSFLDNKGYTDAWHAGIAYRLVSNDQISVVPAAGYGVSRQSLYLTGKGGADPELNSSYSTNWRGPYVTLSAAVKIAKLVKLGAAITYNQVVYNAVGNWNLRPQFQHPVSYRHHAEGYGINGNAFVSVRLASRISARIASNYNSWQTGKGTDMLYLQNGEVDKTQLNGVYCKGFNVNMGLDLDF